MNDLISRQAAIEALGEEPLVWTDTEEELAVWEQCRSHVEAIKSLPSAEPERKKGKWKRKIVDNGWNADWVCSECGYHVKYDFVDFNYCPNCGADMRGGRLDETD